MYNLLQVKINFWVLVGFDDLIWNQLLTFCNILICVCSVFDFPSVLIWSFHLTWSCYRPLTVFVQMRMECWLQQMLLLEVLTFLASELLFIISFHILLKYVLGHAFNKYVMLFITEVLFCLRFIFTEVEELHVLLLMAALFHWFLLVIRQSFFHYAGHYPRWYF